MTPPILYSFRRCPYAMRARMTLYYVGVQCELREVVLREKPPSMLEYSAKGTVPVLVLPDKILDESLDVMMWALSQRDPDDWLGVNRTEADDLIWRVDEDFKPILDRYKYHDRYPEQTQLEYRQAAEPYLVELDQKLASQSWLMGDRLSFADVAVMPFVRQFAHVDKAWFDQTAHTNLVGWLNRFLTSELFLAVMTKYPKWQAGDDLLIFPAVSQ
ncbi:MAG: glutathione S-transferase [Pseudomonadales bacterium]|nr:glutathione S-transferase [Pseudomonadales bacterium]